MPRALQDPGDRTARPGGLQLQPLRMRHPAREALPVASAWRAWHDITERTHAEHELKQTGARLTLAAEGANDGLWQWNLRTQEFYVSVRWRTLVGLPADAAIGRPEDWLTRVHAEDVAGLKASLEAHLAGHTEVFQHEHRIRHEDGSYRRFLCRGLAVKGAPRRRDRIAGSFTDTTSTRFAQDSSGRRFPRPADRLVNRGIFVGGLGGRLEEFKARASAMRSQCCISTSTDSSCQR